MATFLTHFFRLSVNKIEMIFCQNLCISIDESLVVLRNSFIPPHSFGVKNAKINFFKEKRDFSAVFTKLTYGWLQTFLTDMKKPQKTLVMLLRTDVLHILKNIAIFGIFENHQ